MEDFQKGRIDYEQKVRASPPETQNQNIISQNQCIIPTVNYGAQT